MSTPPAALYLALVVACAGHEATAPSATGDADWAWDGAAWTSAGETFLPADVATAMPQQPGVVSLHINAEQAASVAVPVLLASLRAGASAWRLDDGRGDPVQVRPPPPPGTTGHVPLLVSHAGLRISSSGGAEKELVCGPCAVASDWPTAEIAKALADEHDDAVIVLFHEDVPWGAVVAAASAAGDRDVRLARGDH